MENIFFRIGKEINIHKLSNYICTIYDIGNYITNKIIDVGCDDFSFYLLTDNAKYVVKIFNKRKTKEDIKNFVKIYELLIKNKVKTPKIIKSKENNLISNTIFEGININLCIFECIEGKDLYSLNKKISKDDIDKLVKLIVLLHSIKNKHEIQYDDYSFMKLESNFEKKKSILPNWLRKDISLFLEEYNKINFKNLPICFIHTDLASTNIIKDKENQLWMIDYISSGTGYRILDIVVCINRCIFDYTDIEYSLKMEKYFLDKYQEFIELEQYELSILNILKKANAYSCFILEYSKIKENQTKENEHWYNTDLGIIKNIHIRK